MPIDATLDRIAWLASGVYFFSRCLTKAIGCKSRSDRNGGIYWFLYNSRLILTSHDCDIAHPGPHEPRIEVCPAIALPGPIDGQFAGTRNSLPSSHQTF